jgi:hypothetical protein
MLRVAGFLKSLKMLLFPLQTKRHIVNVSTISKTIRDCHNLTSFVLNELKYFQLTAIETIGVEHR